MIVAILLVHGGQLLQLSPEGGWRSIAIALLGGGALQYRHPRSLELKA
jgi:hypothetical protein